MALHTTSPRNTGGFSLDDAARAYRSSLSTDRVVICPHCDTEMVPVIGEEHTERVLILRCGQCGRGVVLQRREGEG